MPASPRGEAHKQKLVGSRTQEKGAVTPQETDPALPMSVQESLAESWVGSGLLQGWSSVCLILLSGRFDCLRSVLFWEEDQYHCELPPKNFFYYIL